MTEMLTPKVNFSWIWKLLQKFLVIPMDAACVIHMVEGHVTLHILVGMYYINVWYLNCVTSFQISQGTESISVLEADN
jgi:hypothetical protein